MTQGFLYCSTDGLEAKQARSKVGPKVDQRADGNGLVSDICGEALANHHPGD